MEHICLLCAEFGAKHVSSRAELILAQREIVRTMRGVQLSLSTDNKYHPLCSAYITLQ